MMKKKGTAAQFFDDAEINDLKFLITANINDDKMRSHLKSGSCLSSLQNEARCTCDSSALTFLDQQGLPQLDDEALQKKKIPKQVSRGIKNSVLSKLFPICPLTAGSKVQRPS